MDRDDRVVGVGLLAAASVSPWRIDSKYVAGERSPASCARGHYCERAMAESTAASGGRAGRARAARRVAAAPAAAVARRAARQRLGARRRRRDRARRHRLPRARLDRPSRARARPGRPASSSTSGCSSAPTRTPTTTARPRRSSSASGLRAVDAPEPRATCALAPDDPDAALERRIEVALQSGVPEAPLRRFAEQRKGQRRRASPRSSRPTATSSPASRSRPTSARGRSTRRPATRRRTSACYQADRRVLISGDHLLGRVSLYYDFGHSPDPAGEFLRSLDVVDELDARLCLSGHGRTFTDVRAHVEANRERGRPSAWRRSARRSPRTAASRSPRSRPSRSSTASRSRR